MTKETLRMQMLSGVITESEYKSKLNENLKFHQIEKDRKYFATTDFGIFKKGDEVFIDTVRNLGAEVVIELSNSKGKRDSIKGDLEEEVEVFDNTVKESLNEHYVAGGIVGVGAINNPFEGRKKEKYEDAFEYFLNSKYELNEVEDDMPKAPSHEETDAAQVYEEEVEENLGHNEIASLTPEGRFWIVSWRGMDGSKEKVFTDEDEARAFMNTLEEGKEVEEPNNY